MLRQPRVPLEAAPEAEVSERVRRQLDRVLASPFFCTSKRSAGFLRFVVEQALDGRQDLIKERTIGAEVFGRPEYDPSLDAVVRVAASDLRKRLAQYYQANAEEPLRIELAAGSYVPVFHAVCERPALEESPSAQLPPPRSRRRMPWKWVAGLACLGVLAGGGLAWRSLDSPLDQFWAPVLASSQPALIWSPPGPYYSVSRPLKRLLAQNPAPAEIRISSGDLVRVERVPAAADLVSVLQIARHLQMKGHGVDLRSEDEAPLRELSLRPLILIGAFNNGWTLDLIRQTRYRFQARKAAGGVWLCEIVDTVAGKAWTADETDFSAGSTDYALVARLYHGQTRNVAVVVAGVHEYGTIAAGEFVSNPVYWKELARTAPRNWRNMNLEVVLETRVARKTPGAPRVVASRFW